jgi:hypothetical protein
VQHHTIPGISWLLVPRDDGDMQYHILSTMV